LMGWWDMPSASGTCWCHNRGKWFPTLLPFVADIGWSCDLPKGGNFDGLYKQVMWLKRVDVDYISRSYDWPKKESFDGLHKQLKNDFGIEFPF
jgi:hypothetical protein